MRQKQKHNVKGIECLYNLIGGEQGCDYCYGMYTTEEPSECFFRISFSENSFLHHLGIAPKLVIRTNQGKHVFYGMQDYDDSKSSWFFPINDKKMIELAEARRIFSIMIVHLENSLDLFQYEPNVWNSFFRAGVSECIEEVENSREFESFCHQRILAGITHEIKKRTVSCKELATALSEIAVNPRIANVINTILSDK